MSLPISRPVFLYLNIVIYQPAKSFILTQVLTSIPTEDQTSFKQKIPHSPRVPFAGVPFPPAPQALPIQATPVCDLILLFVPHTVEPPTAASCRYPNNKFSYLFTEFHSNTLLLTGTTMWLLFASQQAMNLPLLLLPALLLPPILAD